MSGHTFFVRCGGCEEMYRAEIDLMCGGPVWLKPRIKRGECQHPVESAQYWDGEAKAWKEQGAQLEVSGEELQKIKGMIGSFLGGASVADHLDDIRDDEVYLWLALGVSTDELHTAQFDSSDGGPRKLIRILAERKPELAEFFPDYILKEDED